MVEFVSLLNKMDFFREVGGASEERIYEAEKVLDLRFANEFREYLSDHGCISAGGHEFTGIGKMKEMSIISVTQECRMMNGNVPEDFYVIEDLGIDRIIIWQDSSGSVYQTVADSVPQKIANSIFEYLSE